MLKRLLSRHHRMIDLLLEGLSRKEIALRLGCTPQCVSIVANSPNVQEVLARRRDSIEKKTDNAIAVTVQEAQEVLERNSLEAARVHVDLLSSDDEAVRQRSANEILNRTGLSGKGQDEGGKTIMIEVDTVNLLQVALRESKDA